MVYCSSLVVVFCVVLLGTLDANVWRTHSSRHYCGLELSNTLSIICNGWYKRSAPPYYSYTVPQIPDDQEDHEWEDTIDRQDALSFVQTTERTDKRGRGIVEECCRNSCTIDELREYCNPSDE